jgi:hypothetical protein
VNVSISAAAATTAPTLFLFLFLFIGRFLLLQRPVVWLHDRARGTGRAFSGNRVTLE